MGAKAVSNRPVKWGGQIYGPEGPVLEFPVAASEGFDYRGGTFVNLDASERLTLAVAGDVRIIGAANVPTATGTFTASSTAGRSTLPVNISNEACYLLPIDAAQTEAALQGFIGQTCDIVVASDIQYADLDASTNDVLQIVDYRFWGTALGQQAVIVRLLRSAMTWTGVV